MEAKKEVVKLKILKPVGPWLPGEEVDVDAETAEQLADGKRAMRLEDHKKMESEKADVSGMSVAEMQAKGLKNVPEQVKADVAVYAKAESAALEGKPLASSEPLTVTGGVTPPTLVHPALAKAGGHEMTDASDLKKSQAEAKKADEKKAEEKKPEQKPQAEKK